MTREYLSIAVAICRAALERGSITRDEYNYVRRCGALLDGEAVTLWFELNGAIYNKQIAIIEDGSLIIEPVLSFDADGKCNGVFSSGAPA